MDGIFEFQYERYSTHSDLMNIKKLKVYFVDFETNF